MTSFPLGEVIRSHDATRRTTKWALELMDQGITYNPRTAIKSQVLADFIAEWTEVQMPPAVVDQEYWTMYFDGSLMKKGTGTGLVFVSPLGVRMRYIVRNHFPSSNNVAKYEALINDLRIAIELGIRRLLAGHRPSHEGIKLPQCQDGCVLLISPPAGGQVRRSQAQSHPKVAH